MTVESLVTEGQVVAASKGAVTASDPRVAPIVEAVSAAIRRYCGWVVAPQVEETLTLDGHGGDTIHLPSLHVVDVSNLSLEGREIPVEDYDWSEAGMIRLRHGQVPDRFRSVQVTLTHGYETAPDLSQVCVQLALNALSSPMGATREQAGQVSVSWAYNEGVSGGLTLTARDRALLDRYRLPNLAGGSY